MQVLWNYSPRKWTYLKNDSKNDNSSRQAFNGFFYIFLYSKNIHNLKKKSIETKIFLGYNALI